ncbi:hypothetical protein HYH02_004102 [Chlamydomonas schloesseri]|uniref:Uncharacterized protein n=1 Tax=Chlamydomonas schloesseri TaxID=2026947 RepID=A0A835WQE3_9CHLO|nr:hypothetical protein HYH02_004102 [Chlamydomonas schloesseri]|eukprot:KAG2451504.1 hypothetical protein HYH02_004102 [Chlamydomonas schloesseri]
MVVVAAAAPTKTAPPAVSSKLAGLSAKRAISKAAKSALVMDPFHTQPSNAESTAVSTAGAVVEAARRVCAELNDDQLLAALKLAYAHCGPARKHSLDALARRGSAMLAATTHAALLEGCLVTEQRQLLLEVLDGKTALTDGLKHALLQLPGPSTTAADPAPASTPASTTTAMTAAPAATAEVPGSWYRKRVQQLSVAELGALMAEGGWLDPVMTRLRTALKASGWKVMMKSAANISPTLAELLCRTPCPAAAPKEHTVQAVARLLVSDGLARAHSHVWPLTAQRILNLIHEYQRLLKTPEEQLARRGLTKVELHLELVRSIHNASNAKQVSRIALSKAVRLAVSSKDGRQAPAAAPPSAAPAAATDVVERREELERATPVTAATGDEPPPLPPAAAEVVAAAVAAQQ